MKIYLVFKLHEGHEWGSDLLGVFDSEQQANNLIDACIARESIEYGEQFNRWEDRYDEIKELPNAPTPPVRLRGDDLYNHLRTGYLLEEEVLNEPF